MDIGRAIQFWLQDPDWIKKVLIGGVLLLVPIIGWLIVSGYYLRHVQNVIAGNDNVLPEWDQWGEDLARGVKVLVVFIAWMLPVIVLQICSTIFSAGEGIAGGTMGLLFGCLGFLVSLAVTFVTPLFVGRLAKREEIADAFQFADIIQEAQRIPAQLLIYVVVAYAVGIVAGFGLILCIIGVVFTLFLAYMITGHLVGQLRRMLDAEAPAQGAAS